MKIKNLTILTALLLIFLSSCGNKDAMPFEKEDVNKKLEFMTSIYKNILTENYNIDTKLTEKLKVCFNCVENGKIYNADVMLFQHLETLGAEKKMYEITDNDVYQTVSDIVNDKKEKDEFDYAFTNRIVPLKYLFVMKLDEVVEAEITDQGDPEKYRDGTFNGGLINGNVLVFDMEKSSYIGAFPVHAENSDIVEGSLKRDILNHVKAAIVENVDLLGLDCDPIL